MIHILTVVSGKCPGFCKCLRSSKSGFATFLNSSGQQKGPALLTSNRQGMTEFSLRVVDMVIVENKYKSYINCSDKDSYVTVFYLVSGEIEEVEVERCREVPILEGTGSRSRNHCGVTVSPLPQEEGINGI